FTILIGCNRESSDEANPLTDRLRSTRDSLQAAWGVNTDWYDQIERQPSSLWQEYFSVPRRVYLEDYDFIDSHVQGDTLFVSLYNYIDEVAAYLSCDRSCRAGLP